MFKFIVICALLTTVCAVRRGFGLSRASYKHAEFKPIYVASDDDDGDAGVLSGASDIRRDAFHYHLGNPKGAGSKASDVHAAVVSSGSNIRPDGFDYHVETTNGVSSQASGDHSGRIHGNFQWISPEGEHVSLNYVADENGYHPDSSLLPTPPPIPEAILKSLEYNKKHPYKEEDDEHHDHHQQYQQSHQPHQYHQHHQPHQHSHHQHQHQQQQFHYKKGRF